MKPFVIIQLRPEDSTADNEFEAILKYGRLSTTETLRVRAEQKGLPDLSLANYSGIIIGGSPFDVTTPEAKKSDIQKTLERQFDQLFSRVVEHDFPLLGCCSGNGLLGHYLATPMSRKYSEPVCCREVELTTAGKKDKLLDGFPNTIPVLLGHKEACDEVPEGAELLIRGSHCPVQMFRVKSNIYATQFHPEGDTEGFTLRIKVYQSHGYFAPEDAEQLIEGLQNIDTQHSQQILQRFVAYYRD